jgi:4-hydroxy-2-oxoglutarate aldolase
MATCALQPGVYAPVLTPFKKNKEQDIDFDLFKIGVARLAKAGVGLVLSGTLGEATLLTREERRGLVDAAREVLKMEALDGKVPIIAGAGAGCLRETVIFAKDAADAGADAVYVNVIFVNCADGVRIVVAPAYYAFVYGKDKSALKGFFISIADESPLPLLIYNVIHFQGSCGTD